MVRVLRDAAVAPALAAAIWLSPVRPALASGFVLYDQSAAALAQGSAVVGGVTDPSANWFNPAGLAYGSCAEVSATVGLAVARTRFTPDQGSAVAGKAGPQVVPNVFGALGVSRNVTLGFGIFAPYGFGIRWPEEWQGREDAIAVRLSVIAFNTNLAFRLHDRVAVAFGVSPLYGSVRFAVGLPNEAGSRGDLGGSGWNWQANVGVMWRVVPRLVHVGATYRGFNHQGRAQMALRGRADFTTTTTVLAESFADQGVQTKLALPDIASVGGTYFPARTLSLGAQVDYTRWSVFDRMDIEFERPTTPRQIIERRSRDALTLRVGAQHVGLVRGLSVRAGAHFDQSTARSETLGPSAPDGNRIGLAVGLGYATSRVSVDVGYMFLRFFAAKAQGGREGPSGTYTTQAHGLALTVSGRGP